MIQYSTCYVDPTIFTTYKEEGRKKKEEQMPVETKVTLNRLQLRTNILYSVAGSLADFSAWSSSATEERPAEPSSDTVAHKPVVTAPGPWSSSNPLRFRAEVGPMIGIQKSHSWWSQLRQKRSAWL